MLFPESIHFYIGIETTAYRLRLGRKEFEQRETEIRCYWDRENGFAPCESAKRDA